MAFDVTADADRATGETLVVGQSHLGLAGVTAADYLVRHLASTRIGRVDTDALPAIAPFEAGVPRHHSRLYALDDAPMTVLVGELFVPADAARAYADTLLDWCAARDVAEIAVLHGVPFSHSPDQHAVFHVATDAYRTERLPAGVFNPLQGGFLDGVVGELVARSLDADAPDVGVYVTPTHPPGPDVDAALTLLDGLHDAYDLSVDETELRALGDQLRAYYEQLADRTATAAERESPLGYDDADDQMYR